MSQSPSTETKTLADRVEHWYSGADVPMSVIRRYARQIADCFHPEKIILFGSYAYGTPHAGSDVDILVIMPGATSSLRPGKSIARWPVTFLSI